MRKRVRFAGLATCAGWRWLVETTTYFGAGAAVLLLLGVSITSAVTLPHWWLGFVVFGALYGLLFAEGSYRVWCGEEERLAAVEAAPRPYLRFAEPEVTQAGVVTSAFQPTGTTVHLRHADVVLFFARINVVNDPPLGARGAIAERVTATIEFRSFTDGTYPLRMVGRWAETPQRGETGRLGINLEEAQLDIVANGLSHPMDVIMKDLRDQFCFAYNHENASAMDLKLPAHELTEAGYLVRVTLRGANVDPVTADYVLTCNAGVPPELRGPNEPQALNDADEAVDT